MIILGCFRGTIISGNTHIKPAISSRLDHYMHPRGAIKFVAGLFSALASFSNFTSVFGMWRGDPRCIADLLERVTNLTIKKPFWFFSVKKLWWKSPFPHHTLGQNAASFFEFHASKLLQHLKHQVFILSASPSGAGVKVASKNQRPATWVLDSFLPVGGWTNPFEKY